MAPVLCSQAEVVVAPCTEGPQKHTDGSVFVSDASTLIPMQQDIVATQELGFQLQSSTCYVSPRREEYYQYM